MRISWKQTLFFALLVGTINLAQANQAEADVDDTLSEEQRQYQEWAQQTLESLTPISGDVDLPGDVAHLTIPDTFYYLSPADSRTVLVDIWGNPPELADDMLGMLFPAGANPFEAESWGVTIEYVEEGYVSDSDADDIDYDALLKQMQEDTEEDSKYRVEQGYEAIKLVGWAAEPYYDASSNKLHWAKELQFGSNQQHTLNYNIRVLGRKGVLVLNFIAGMDQLEMINGNLDNVLAMAEFNQGARYADFDPEVDEVAAYGIGALVAGKALAKTGFFAAALLLLKKFWILIPIGIAAFWKKIFRKKEPAHE